MIAKLIVGSLARFPGSKASFLAGLSAPDILSFITTEKGGVARAKGEGESWLQLKRVE